MDDLLSTTSTRPADDALPEWVIARAAEYMVRRYGRAALNRAASRHRVLRRQGDDLAAIHWMRVAEAIAALANRQRKMHDA
jgi:hypothetical protein